MTTVGIAKVSSGLPTAGSFEPAGAFGQLSELGNTILFMLSDDAVPPPQLAPVLAELFATMVFWRRISSFIVPPLSPSPSL